MKIECRMQQLSVICRSAKSAFSASRKSFKNRTGDFNDSQSVIFFPLCLSFCVCVCVPVRSIIISMKTRCLLMFQNSLKTYSAAKYIIYFHLSARLTNGKIHFHF